MKFTAATKTRAAAPDALCAKSAQNHTPETYRRGLNMRQFVAPSITFFALTLGLLLGHARAQSSDAAKTQAAGGVQVASGPRASDVASIDSIIAALYDVIS